MACINCGDGCKWNVTHSCKVCELVDGDTSMKLVCHCSLCGEYICKAHWKDALARLEAIAKNTAQKIRKKITNTFKKQNNGSSLDPDIKSAD
jgi:hypothetical protein